MTHIPDDEYERRVQALGARLQGHEGLRWHVESVRSNFDIPDGYQFDTDHVLVTVREGKMVYRVPMSLDFLDDAFDAAVQAVVRGARKAWGD